MTSPPPRCPPRSSTLFPGSNEVGAHFGVVIAKHGGHHVEIATFRTDGSYRDGRRPETVTFSTAQDDAQRRDFTINGLFEAPETGEVIDYVGGLADLKAGVLRAIGDPVARFTEDGLRLLRAVRFATHPGVRHRSGHRRGAPGLRPPARPDLARAHPRRVFQDPHLTAPPQRHRTSGRQRADPPFPARVVTDDRLRATAGMAPRRRCLHPHPHHARHARGGRAVRAVSRRAVARHRQAALPHHRC